MSIFIRRMNVCCIIHFLIILTLIIFTGEPELVDQIIMALGLGSTGQMINPGAAPGAQPAPGFAPLSLVSQPLNKILAPSALTLQCDDTRKTCQHVTVPHGTYIY